MKRVSVKLPQDMVEELDKRADHQGVTRSDVIRNILEDGLNTENDERIQHLQGEIEYLENQVERLQRTNLKILEERDHSTELEVYVSDRKEWERASWLTRQKWRLFGKG